MATPDNVAVAEVTVRRIVGVPFPATTATRLITSQGILLVGYAVEESTGAATARVEIINGSDENGISTIPVTLAIGGSVREYIPWPYIPLDGGIFIDVTAGSVAGTFFIGIPD
ncbi:MAG: hypothetical protein ACREHG_02655 [Candidatus Saccharimonadales bacterium]